MSECTVPECERSEYARGLCAAHYQRHNRGAGAFGAIGPPRENARVEADSCAFDGCNAPRFQVTRNGRNNGRSRWCSFHRKAEHRKPRFVGGPDRFRTAPPPPR